MARIKHGTLTANVVVTVTLDEPYDYITVINRNGLGEIYFRFDGVAPEPEADDNFVVPAVITSTKVGGETDETTVVQLVSTAACTYTVMGS